MNLPNTPRLDRRTALKWLLTATAAVAIADRRLFAAPGTATTPAGKGYGTDPALNKEYQPGELWPLTMTDAQRRTATALCAVIIPAEGTVPSAADLHVQDFIDEWISSPYPDQVNDRKTIIDGLAWIDEESRKRFGKDFASLEVKEAGVICDDICHLPDARPELKQGAKFFAKFRDLTTSGFYTTPEGMKDIGYVGNMPLPEFKGPPREVLAKLGLA
ncbi:MAG TPA: gluconate 2-dehydrogenase subunit 3 family protein [Lacunisphaera sp.]|jgi:hypothetical protein|nr:gluconate 2-dehydrogenase subunit 3 family protein [Lacunisphaera sp.]